MWGCKRSQDNCCSSRTVSAQHMALSSIVSGIENKCIYMPEFFLPICQHCATAAKWTLAKRKECMAITVIMLKAVAVRKVVGKHRGNHVWKLHLFFNGFGFAHTSKFSAVLNATLKLFQWQNVALTDCRCRAPFTQCLLALSWGGVAVKSPAPSHSSLPSDITSLYNFLYNMQLLLSPTELHSIS